MQATTSTTLPLRPSSSISLPTETQSCPHLPEKLANMLCAVCNAQPPKYTCPRCLVKTCSLPCSTSHKANTGCSGIRDKVAYVPMNEYGWGTMMDDYTYLEEVARKVSDVGREIVASKLMTSARRGMGAQSMRGRGRGGKGGLTSSKRDYLSLQLSFRDIDMDVLPAGMERHRINQSAWDAKKQTAFMTIEYIFHNPLRSSEPPLKILTHRNSLNMTLRNLIEKHLTENSKMKKDTALVEWLSPLIADGNIGNSPLCIIQASEAETHINASKIKMNLQSSRTPTYHKLDWCLKLVSALKYKHFVEFPTIEVMEESTFKGTLIDEDGVHHEAVEAKPIKRRRLDPEAAQKNLDGLLGGYGSGSDDESETAAAIVPLLAGYDEVEMDDDNLQEGEGDVDDVEEDEQPDSGDPHSMSIEELQALVAQSLDNDALDPEELAELKEDERRLAELQAAIQRR